MEKTLIPRCSSPVDNVVTPGLVFPSELSFHNEVESDRNLPNSSISLDIAEKECNFKGKSIKHHLHINNFGLHRWLMFKVYKE